MRLYSISIKNRGFNGLHNCFEILVKNCVYIYSVNSTVNWKFHTKDLTLFVPAKLYHRRRKYNSLVDKISQRGQNARRRDW